MEGGNAGATGEQYLAKTDGTTIPLKGIDHAQVAAGDKIIVKTPGGGGWGSP